MSSGRRFSYASVRSSPMRANSYAPAPAPIKKTKSFFSEIGDSDKFFYGVIGAGIIIAILLDAGVHILKKPNNIGSGLDRLQINGRVYVPLP